MKSCPLSAPAAWVRCIAHAIPSLGDTLPSRFFPSSSPETPIDWRASNEKPRRSPRSIILTSPRFMASRKVTAGPFVLIMAFVDGADLSRRISRGPIPLDESLSICGQIIDALEAAHDHGIVHRDLKPANIELRADGTIKVLDFGLAKEVARDVDHVLTNSPTVAGSGTQAGVLLGTAAYMSPKQARGRVVDARADIWAFGCLLFELITGRMVFSGESLADVLSGVIGRDPDWSAIPLRTPEPLRRLLRRCLEKDVRRRLRHIGDARWEIEEASSRGVPGPAAAPRRPWTSTAWVARCVSRREGSRRPW